MPNFHICATIIHKMITPVMSCSSFEREEKVCISPSCTVKLYHLLYFFTTAVGPTLLKIIFGLGWPSAPWRCREKNA